MGVVAINKLPLSYRFEISGLTELQTDALEELCVRALYELAHRGGNPDEMVARSLLLPREVEQLPPM